jgi:hypothetical protein
MRSYGYLKYDPKYDLKKRGGKATKFNDWWLILQAGQGITKYYQWWLQKEGVWDVWSRDWLEKAELDPDLKMMWTMRQRGIKLTGSAWGPHVSVIRGNYDFVNTAGYHDMNYEQAVEAFHKREQLWRKHQDKKIWFEYNPKYLNTNGKHWWIRAVSPQLEEIRMELGLTPQPIYFHRNSQTWRVNPFHLTIGHMLN